MSFPLAELFFSEYNSDPSRNYLVSAPTGSGKTHIAKRVLAKSDGLSVYVSPLKALSREVYNSLRNRTRALLVDTDAYEDDLRRVSSDVLLLTYEKFDSSIRHGYPWLEKVSRLVIDEVHNVETSRGLALENIVLWAKARHVPTISLSATLSNPDKYTSWLNAKMISHQKRTVPLHECVAYPYVLKCGDWEETFSPHKLTRPRFEVLVQVLEKITGKGKNALVFVKSRRSAESLALELRKRDFRAHHYHSGMPYDERTKVLDMLLQGDINVVVSTTALGQGVNLPVYAVLFYELKLPDVNEKGEFKGWKDVTVSEFRQMAGRAGRPKYDSEGMVIIISNSERTARDLAQRYYHGAMTSQNAKPDLDTLSLAYISWNDGVEMDEFRSSLNSTFNFNGIEASKIEYSLSRLKEMKLVVLNRGISVTSLGHAVAVSYIDVKALSGFPLEDEKVDLVSAIVGSPAVAPSLRGCKDGVQLLSKWMGGELLEGVCDKLTTKDVNEVISNARWISFAMFRVLKALGDNRYLRALEIHENLKYGVPSEGIKLAKAGIPRDVTLDLVKSGITDLREMCIRIGLRELRDNLRRHGIQVEVLCREIYSNDTVAFDVRRALQELQDKEFSLGDVEKRFGRDVARELLRKKLIERKDEKYVVRRMKFGQD